MILYIVGFTRAGKSTLARSLAKSLNIGYVDTDEMVEALIGKSIEEYVLNEGWDAFRARETQVLYETREQDFALGSFFASATGIKGVVSCGGGIVERRENRDFLRGTALVWLSPPWELIKSRIRREPSAFTIGKSEAELYEEYLRRTQLYRSLFIDI